jgi:4-alpha-glucanotransferase
MPAAPRGLHRLARLHGVQTMYRDTEGERVAASPETLMAALRALRVPVEEAAGIPTLISLREQALADRVLEPVVVAWTGGSPVRPNRFTLRLPAREAARPVRVRVALEEGGAREWDVELAGFEAEEEGLYHLPLPALPPGYHDLHVTIGGSGSGGEARFEAWLIVAPVRATAWARAVGERGWGVFAPLYALWEDTGGGLEAAGAPSFFHLDRLAARVAERGGSVVGTLPLMAAFLDDPFEPSPYSAVTRLFWNELYVEPPAGVATGGVDSPPYQDRLFHPRTAMAAKRPALEAAARAFFQRVDGDPPELDPFLARDPRAGDYARFRALVERHGRWSEWPDRLRARDVRPGDYDEDVARYHLYVQWLAERQLTAVKERAESRGVGLYLDLPLGVNPDGYDVWRERELFAVDARAGAPPDALAAGGQDWGFPPLHPEASRLDGHRYFVACIRKHLRFARVLRIDHVMQFHRMYWAVGPSAREGVYVRYPSEELLAVLCLESVRAGAVIVGEDLGTVPREVRRDMKRHGMPGMYVAQFELRETGRGDAIAPRRVTAGALASIDTHDTPTFAGWWTGRDAEARGALGDLEPEAVAAEREGRGEMRRKLAAGLGVDVPPDPAGTAGEATADAVHRALLMELGRSRAGLVLATMEDLWLETEPQNMPGTMVDANWRRQARRPLEALGEPGIARVLDELNHAREEAI